MTTKVGLLRVEHICQGRPCLMPNATVQSMIQSGKEVKDDSAAAAAVEEKEYQCFETSGGLWKATDGHRTCTLPEGGTWTCHMGMNNGRDEGYVHNKSKAMTLWIDELIDVSDVEDWGRGPYIYIYI